MNQPSAPTRSSAPASSTLPSIDQLIEQAQRLRHQAPAEAVPLARAAADQAQALSQPLLQARALSVLSACLRNASDLIGAAQASQQACELYEAQAAAPAVEFARVLVNRGIAWSLLGRHAEALRSFEQARELSRNAGDIEGEADALLDIAVVANLLGDDARALAIYAQTLPLYTALGDDYHRASALNNMAYAHVCWGARLVKSDEAAAAAPHFDSAISLVNEALPLAEAGAHPEFVVSCLDTLASALREQGRWDEAIACLQRQLAQARRLDGPRMVANSLATLGEVLRRTGRLPEALDALQEADQHFLALQLAEQHAGALLSLTDALEASGRPAEALQAHRRYHQLAAQAQQAAAQDQLQTLSSRLALERAEAELARSRQRSRELAELNEQLQAAARERESLMQELQRQSLEDALTGLANRRAFDQRLAMELERAQRHGTPLTLVLLDIDHFKQINDQGSHAAGDEVLLQLGRLLARQRRPADLAARLGGDELALLLPDTDEAGAQALCIALGERIAAHPWAGGLARRTPTLSVGLATLGAERASAAQLLAQADALLYQAKSEGRNRVCGLAGCQTLVPGRVATQR